MPRPQFSLKTLLWLMLATAIGCVVVPPAVKAYAEYRERHKYDELIQLIQETVDYGSDWTDRSDDEPGAQE
jgi:hypothetical protein